jgi:hypothetical protein
VAIPDEYRLAIERQEQESDRYWTRSNVLLLVQGALISFYTNIDDKRTLFAVAVAIQGLFLAIIWLGVIKKGKNYVERWDNVIGHIEQQEQAKQDQSNLAYPLNTLNNVAKRDEKPARLPLYRQSTTTLMKYAIASVVVFWSLMIVLALTGNDTLAPDEDQTEATVSGITLSVEGSAFPQAP